MYKYGIKNKPYADFHKLLRQGMREVVITRSTKKIISKVPQLMQWSVKYVK
jgi:hypothetical protein